MGRLQARVVCPGLPCHCGRLGDWGCSYHHGLISSHAPRDKLGHWRGHCPVQSGSGWPSIWQSADSAQPCPPLGWMSPWSWGYWSPAQLWVCWRGGWHPYQPEGDLQTNGWACLVPYPPPWKVTSLSSSLSILPTPETLKPPQSDPWGCAAPPLAISTWRTPSTSQSWLRQSSLMSWVRSVWGLSLGWTSLGEGWVSTSSPWVGTRGVAGHGSNVVPYLHSCGGPDMEPNWLIMPGCSCSKMLWCCRHASTGWKH